MKQLILTFHLNISLIFLFLSSFHLHTQHNEGGFIFLPNDKNLYNAIPSTTAPKAKSNINYYSLQNFAATVEDQKGIPACLPFSFAQAYSILINQSFGWELGKQDFTQEDLDISALSGIFNYVRIILKFGYGCKALLSPTEVIKSYQKNGVCLRSEYSISPYYDPDTAPCYPTIPNIINQEALNYRLNNVSKVFHTDSINTSSVLTNMMNTLLNNQPIIAGMKLPKDYEKEIKMNGKATFTPIPSVDDALYHAIVITGFKINENKELYFQIMDSRGLRLGEKGYWWIKATNLQQRLVFGYVLNLPKKNKSLDTYFTLIDAIYDDELSLKGLYDSSKNEYIYKKNWKTNNIRIRTSIVNIKKDNHIYMLSYDEKKFTHEANTIANIEKEPILFPLKAGESNLISKQKNQYIIFLYTYNKIDINDILKKLNKSNQSSIYQAIKEVIGEDLVTNIQYNENIINCKVSDIETIPIKGNVIPIIIKFEK